MMEEKKNGKRMSVKNMSPQGIVLKNRFKERLKERCIVRMKKNRRQILQHLRKSASTISEAAQGLLCAENSSDETEQLQKVHSESLDDLMIDGELSYDDYMEVLHSLEEALELEMRVGLESQQIEEQLDFEEASLAASIEHMYDESITPYQSCNSESAVCIMCKKLTLLEGDGGRIVYCPCGFRFSLQNDAMGLSYFQSRILAELTKHRNGGCRNNEPSFEIQNQFGKVEVLYLKCSFCDYFSVVV